MPKHSTAKMELVYSQSEDGSYEVRVNTDRVLLNTEDVAKVMGLSVGVVRELVAQKKLKVMGDPKHNAVKKFSVQHIMEKLNEEKFLNYAVNLTYQFNQSRNEAYKTKLQQDEES